MVLRSYYKKRTAFKVTYLLLVCLPLVNHSDFGFNGGLDLGFALAGLDAAGFTPLV